MELEWNFHGRAEEGRAVTAEAAAAAPGTPPCAPASRPSGRPARSSAPGGSRSSACRSARPPRAAPPWWCSRRGRRAAWPAPLPPPPPAATAWRRRPPRQRPSPPALSHRPTRGRSYRPVKQVEALFYLTQPQRRKLSSMPRSEAHVSRHSAWSLVAGVFEGAQVLITALLFQEAIMNTNCDLSGLAWSPVTAAAVAVAVLAAAPLRVALPLVAVGALGYGIAAASDKIQGWMRQRMRQLMDKAEAARSAAQPRCCVCQSAPATTRFVPCGHLVCLSCSHKSSGGPRESRSTCYMCNIHHLGF